MATIHSGNYYLSMNQMRDNARYIRDYLTARGWSLNAICGMLGNMQTESTINPGIWQGLIVDDTTQGYGLVQWTPASKYLNWCNAQGLSPSSMDSALMRIEYELENNLQYYPTDAYPLTFSEFKTSTRDPSYLAMTFLANYERPAEPNQPARGTQAESWYNYLSTGNIPSSGGSHSSKSMNLLLKYIATRRRV